MSKVLHARWAAGAATAGVAAHLAMAALGGWMAALALAMASICAPCAWTMLRSPSVRAARMLVGMSLGMAVLHGALLLGAVPAVGHAHTSSAALPAAMGSSHGAAHAAATLAVMGADFAVALLAASWLRRVEGAR